MMQDYMQNPLQQFQKYSDLFKRNGIYEDAKEKSEIYSLDD